MILRGRYWEISVGTTLVRFDNAAVGDRPLTCRFDITKTLGREPNKARVELYNLSPATRDTMESADEPEVQVIAGYQSDGLHDTIFVGDSQDIYTQLSEDGTDYVTVIEAKDGGRSYRTARISHSFDAGVSLATVINRCAEAMGIGTGNTASIAASAELDSGESLFQDGLTLEGPAWRQLDMVCRSASLRWSVQSGVLQLRQASRPAEVRAVRLTPTTGLIGSPTRSNKDPRTGEVTIEAKSLLIPGIYPGRVVVLESAEINGSYMCHSVRYTGDTTATDWYAVAALKDYDEQ